MKKLLPLLASALLLLTTPVYAQEHSEHASETPHAAQQASHNQSASKKAKSDNKAQAKQERAQNQQVKNENKAEAKQAKSNNQAQAKQEKSNVRVQKQEQKPNAGVQRQSNAQHQQRANVERNSSAKQNWDGHKFKPEYFRSNFGREHSFGFRSARWEGRPFYRGSRFFYGGTWFILGYDVPLDWYECNTYIDEDGDSYYLYCPEYPGVRFAVNAVF